MTRQIRIHLFKTLQRLNLGICSIGIEINAEGLMIAYVMDKHGEAWYL